MNESVSHNLTIIIEKAIDSKEIQARQVRAEDEQYFVYLRTNDGFKIEFSFYFDEEKENHKELKTAIKNLFNYNVSSNLPF